ncbi:benzil reductase ((S)-benzoin forming) [Andreprevotia lacus DSM 23236]|jgi:NAD(P)-dependent dehydrogenase (short-subunit alcohol dehydrogenase family)|uniref:Benzil reductase ((S)-benzoin forming) n=1 Tax=Andreprevotia lacus DSM 23236 TaxID=1121001 RepID=A0A1W1Y0P6_9NEIS|nr:SDR family NAD(P)-dependent oxidoreductase [Andreprevotia lacus]SMC29328.1 benzil reductase ((S)-benzoin forming) [Andreprevotia lacus DSM 23236]
MNKLAIITGGSHGLGAALVDQYTQAGWQVAELSRSGSGPAHVDLDLADLAQALGTVRPLFARLASQPWAEVALISNAGMLTPLLPVARLDAAAITHNLNVNLLGAVQLIAAFVQAFDRVSARKTVAQISSGAARKGYGSWSLYCAAKAGMDNFIRALAVEQAAAAAPFICISIDPDVMDTRMQGEIRATPDDDFPDVARFIARKQAGQLRSAAEVANYVADVISRAENGRSYDIEAAD